jgi:hypothetical protein
MIGSPLSVICSRCPIDLDKPHFSSQAAETSFFAILNSEFSLNFGINISGSKLNELIQVFTLSVNSCWTIPFITVVFLIG